MRRTALFIAATVGLATVAVAHEGVKNPAVMARMEGMKLIAQHTKVLGDMAKGARPFNAEEAQAAARALAAEAARVPALFEAEEDDPKSEAKPAIWFDYAAFTAEANALIDAANGATGLKTSGDIIKVMQAIGATCSSCHKSFRE